MTGASRESRLLPLPRKPNYDFEKRRKELDRKTKRENKREDRRLRREQEPDGQQPPALEGDVAPPEGPPTE